MTDPVTADDGHNYQRIELDRQLRKSNHNPTYYSRFTRQQIHTYVPNQALREKIDSLYFLFYFSSIIIALFRVSTKTSANNT